MSRTAAVTRGRSLRLPRPHRAGAWLLVVACALTVGYLWVRESSLVAVEDVTITGLTGPEAPKLRALLADTARDMTTLHVREEQLREVTEPYAVVKGLEVRTDFPHGMTIVVHEHVAVGAILVDGRRTPVAADGTLLRGAAPGDVPVVPMHVPATGNRVVDVDALQALRTLGAAPRPLRLRVQKVTLTRDGLLLELERGPELRFGAAERLNAKWAAAARVLADPTSAGATYVDVRYPERPAAGGLEDPTKQMDPAEAARATPLPEQSQPGVEPVTGP